LDISNLIAGLNLW